MNSIYKKCHLPIGACWLLFVTITGCGQEPAPAQPQNTTVLKIVRGGGLPPPNAPQAEVEHYSFTLAEDGTWEWRFGVFQKRGVKSGTLKADEVPRWIKEIEKGGFHQLESNPELGNADESFIDITILTKDRQTQKRISFGEKLAKAIHEKVIEVANSGEAIGSKSDRPLDAATFNAGLAPDDKRILAFVAWLKQQGVTLQFAKYPEGDGGSWRLIQPRTSDEYTVSFSIRSFPSGASEEQMRKALDINLGYLLNAPEHLAMSHAMTSGARPDSKLPKSDDELPQVDGVAVNEKVESLFKQYKSEPK